MRPLMSSALPATEITALLGRGTHFEGKLSFDGRVRIDGSFRGEISSDDTLIVGDGAEVEAEILAGTVIIKGGSVSGNVRARRSIELYVPARVSGTLQAPEVFMDKGVQFSGSCTMPRSTSAAPERAREAKPQREREAVVVLRHPHIPCGTLQRGPGAGECWFLPVRKEMPATIRKLGVEPCWVRRRRVASACSLQLEVVTP